MLFPEFHHQDHELFALIKFRSIILDQGIINQIFLITIHKPL